MLFQKITTPQCGMCGREGEENSGKNIISVYCLNCKAWAHKKVLLLWNGLSVLNKASLFKDQVGEDSAFPIVFSG
jgi:hypothetical protein